MVVVTAFTVPYHVRGASILTWIPPTCSERWRDLRTMCSQDSLSRRSFSMQVLPNSRVSERRHHFLRRNFFSRTYQSRATVAEQASLSAKKLKLQHQAVAFPWLVQQPLKRAASAAGVALAMWLISLQAKPGPSFLQASKTTKLSIVCFMYLLVDLVGYSFWDSLPFYAFMYCTNSPW